MKYIMYCRKSQESEDRQVLSLESQKEELIERFENHPEIEIKHQITEAKSAKAPGREHFNKMISIIQSGKCDGIMAWHPDRLARNSVDGGLIIYLLDIGVLKDLKFVTYNFDNTPEGKLMLAHLFSQSKYFIDGLSKNVKRGNRTKIKNGWLPNMAPIGYLNCKETKTIIPDPNRFKIIQELFRLMTTGCYTPKMLYEKAKNDFGLRTVKRKRSGGKPLSLSSFYTLLSNPFYTGLIPWKGNVHPGKHKPLISMAEFETVQKILNGRKLKPRTHKPGLRFAYTGLMTCGECNCAITAEKKTNRFGSKYVYYHCTHRKTGYICNQGSLEVTYLEDQFISFLDRLQISQEMYNLITELVDKQKISDEGLNKVTIKSLHATQKSNETRFKNLINMRMNDLLDDQEYKNQRKKLQFEQQKITEEIKTLSKSDEWLEPFKNWLELRKQAKYWFLNGDLEVKRLIMKTLGSNPIVMNKKLSVQAAKPFFEIEESMDFPNLLGVIERFRKQYGKCDVRVTLSTLKELKKLVNEQKKNH